MHYLKSVVIRITPLLVLPTTTHFVRCLVIREGVASVGGGGSSFVLLVNGRERVINNKQHMSTVIVVNHNYFIAGRRRRSNWSRAGMQAVLGFPTPLRPPPSTSGRPSFLSLHPRKD